MGESSVSSSAPVNRRHLGWSRRGGRRRAAASRRLPVLLVLALVAMSAVVGLVTSTASAAGTTTITKQLDSVQNAGYTAPNTFVVGSLVRYRLTASCSSNTVNCGVGTVTDVLDPRLEFVEVLRPSGAIPTASAYDAGTRTVTVSVGTAASPFPDGGIAEFTVVARVKAGATGVIPNVSTITNTSEPGVVATSQQVDIQVQPGTPDWDMKKLINGASTVAQDSVVSFYFNYYAMRIIGNVAVTGGTLVDTYPAGAEFVSATGNYVHDPVARTVTWQIDPMDPAAGGMACSTNLGTCSQSGPTLKLKFPAAAFPDGSKPVNTVVATYNYADGTTGTDNGAATVTIEAPNNVATLTKTGPATVPAGGAVRWGLAYANTGNTALDSVVITDELPPTSQVSSVRVSPGTMPTGSAITKLEGLVGGTWTAMPLLYPSPVPAGATRLRATVGPVNAGRTINLSLVGTVASDLADGVTIRNCATASAAATPDTTSCVESTVDQPHVTLAPYKTTLYPGTTQTSVQPNGTAYFGISYWSQQASDGIKTIELTDVLPKELEFVKMTCGFYGWGGARNSPIDVGWNAAATASPAGCAKGTAPGNAPMPDPQQSVNPDGSTTLHWKITAPANANTIPKDTFANDGYAIFFEVRAKEGTATGKYTNRVYETTDEASYSCFANADTTSLPDTQDLDGDGNTTEVLCGVKADIIIDRLAQADVYKWVKGNIGENVAEATGQPDSSCPDWGGYTRYPCVATLTPGGTFNYRFRAVNTGNQDLTNWVVYDILPHAGDVGVNEALVNSARETDWTPEVTGPLTLETAAANSPLPADANPVVRYSTSWNPCRPEMGDPPGDTSWLGGCDNTWYTEAQIAAMPGGWSNVKSFRVEIFQGEKAWAGGQDIVWNLPMKAPADAPTSTESPLDLSIAWNSIGHQGDRLNADGTTEFLPAAAPRKVGVIVPFVLPKLVSVGDYVWWDNNRDGVQDAAEPVVPGVQVDLHAKDGSLVASTTTDADGYYSFTDLVVATDYELRFTAPSGASWTVRDAGGDDARDSDVNPATGRVSFTTPATEGANLPTKKADGTFADLPTLDAGLVKYNLVLDKTKTPASGPWFAGQSISYTLTPKNEGPATALAGWSVTDLLPAGLTATAISGSGYTCALATLTCVAGAPLAGGATGSPITVAVTIDATATGTLKNVAWVDKAPGDVPETNPLGTPPTTATDTGASSTDNDDEQSLTLTLPVAVGDYVWLDTNRDGIQDATDVPVAGATLSITTADGSAVTDVFGHSVTTTTTDASGRYLFDNLPPGQYTVTFESLPATLTGYSPTLTGQGTTATDSSTGSATSVTLAGGEQDLTLDFGFVQDLVSLGDYVWWDTDRDGIQDASEAPVPGVTVELKDGNTTVATTTTDANGLYLFDGLLPGKDFTIVFTAPDGATWTTRDAGGDNAKDSDVDPATGELAATSPQQGSDLTYDGGLVKYNLKLAKTLDTAPPFAPGKTVTFTLTPHNDGPVDALAGWSVTEVLPSQLTLVSMTGTGYTCSDVTCTAGASLAAGADGAPITVKATIKAGSTGVIKNVAYVDKAPSDVAETIPLGTPPTTSTDTGTSTTDNDAEAELTVPLVSIGDYVWFDTNRDGVQDTGELPVGDVTVELFDDNGDSVGTTTTDVNGFYSFVNLVPDTDYTLVFTRPDGTRWTTKDAGDDNAKDSDVNPADGKVAVHTPMTGENSPTTPDDPTYDGGLVKYNLSLTKTLDSDGPYYSGQTVTFTLTPHNDGPVDALAGWSVTEVLPAGLQLVSMSGTDYACDLATATCTSSKVLAHGMDGAPITVTATIGAGFSGQLRNVAYVAPAGEDGPETNPLVVPEPDTDTSTTPTDNDADVPLTVQKPVKVGDYVWIDTNRDGLQDGSDVPVKGATLTLTDTLGNPVKNIFGDEVGPLRTDAAGHYLFENLPEGTYVVTIDPSTAPALKGMLPTTVEVGDNRAVDSSKDEATSVALTSAGVEEDLTLDFGFIPPAVQVGNYVWFDANHDGLQGSNEQGIGGVTLTLVGPDGKPVTDVTGAPVGPVRTAADGSYLFSLLPVLGEGQHYTVRLDASTLPKGYRPTKAEAGSDRGTDSSTGESSSWLPLAVDGAEDLTLDFGFWLPGPAVSIVKGDAAGNAADTRADEVTLPTGATRLKFVVTNTGDETLRDIKVSDRVVAGGTVTDLTCTFPDGSTGASWPGPFEPKASFKCTAQLSGVEGRHHDIASVVAVGEQSGTSVTDENAYHAVHLSPQTPTDPTDPPVPGVPGLPDTGSSRLLGWGLLAGLVLLGTGAALTAPRRRHQR